MAKAKAGHEAAGPREHVRGLDRGINEPRRQRMNWEVQACAEGRPKDLDPSGRDGVIIARPDAVERRSGGTCIWGGARGVRRPRRRGGDCRALRTVFTWAQHCLEPLLKFANFLEVSRPISAAQRPFRPKENGRLEINPGTRR